MSLAPEMNAVLLGRNKKRTFRVLGAAIALFLGIFFLGAIAETQSWMTEVMEQIHLVVLFVLVAGGVIAAGNAYWNDGLVLSWLLVFAPVFPWLWHFFVQGTVLFDEVVEPLAWAVFTTLLVGTVGYVTGRYLRKFATRDAWDEPSDWLLQLLVGYDPARSIQWGLLASGLFVVASGLTFVVQSYILRPVEGIALIEMFYPTGILAADPLLGAIIILGWIGLAGWPAYRNAGLLVSWGLLLGPLFGAILTEFVMESVSGGGPVIDATFALLAALIFALIHGTGGFLFGTGLRRIITSRRNKRRGQEANT